jgi:hypothetical protein
MFTILPGYCISKNQLVNSEFKSLGMLPFGTGLNNESWHQLEPIYNEKLKVKNLVSLSLVRVCFKIGRPT